MALRPWAINFVYNINYLDLFNLCLVLNGITITIVESW